MALYQSLDPVNSTITHPPSSDHYGGASDFPHCLLTISYPLHVYGEASDVPLCQMQIDGRRSATYPETQSCGASLIDSAFYEGGPQQQKSQRHNAPQSPIQPVQKYHRHFLRNPPTHSPSDLEAPLTDQHKLESCRSTVVSTEETPSPRPRPKKQGEKLTEEDVELLLSLKKEKKLPWSKIAEYFPGRSSGTLQVYYCKKLKNRGKLWTADTVSVIAYKHQWVR
jgi:hypothetical protein